jgi:hypothetical protein
LKIISTQKTRGGVGEKVRRRQREFHPEDRHNSYSLLNVIWDHKIEQDDVDGTNNTHGGDD